VSGGKQYILMEGYQVMLDLNNVLAHIGCRSPTERALETVPHTRVY
jgi:hypothetical protein